MEINLLDKMLSAYHQQQQRITIVLQNNARVSGTIRAFDSYVIVLENLKRDIVYRHAVSTLTPASATLEQKPVPQRSEKVRPAPRAGKTAAPPAARQKGQRQPARAPEAAEAGINTGMKEGLLRWMQEQKASK